MTPTEQKCLTDHRFLIETFMEIRHRETGQLVPFLFNSIQSGYWNKRTKRDVILKSRKPGFSTLKLAEGLALSMTNEGWHSEVVVQEPKTYQELREAQLIMFNSVPEELRPSVRWDSMGSGVLYFDKLESKCTISMAGSSLNVAKRSGRGATRQFLHLSEYAYYAYPEVTYNSFSNSVPIDGIISIESTPNGFNDFKEKVDGARAGSNNFKLHFYRWFDDPVNKIESGEPIENLTEDEIILTREYKLTDSQIRFRRWKIREIGIKQFMQEWPENIDHCFLRAGNMFFDLDALEAQRENIRQPIKGFKDGLLVFKKPAKDKKYVIGCDTAEGIEEGDYCSATVVDKETGEEVAHLYGQWKPEYYAERLCQVGRWYNNALLGVERNNHGHTVILRLQDLKYPALYKHRDGKIGWLTTGGQSTTQQGIRTVMLDEWDEALRNGDTVLRCEISLSEHYGFRVHPDGVARGTPHDDTIFSKAIAHQMRKHRQFKQGGA